MSNFLKYMRLFALGITFSSSMALIFAARNAINVLKARAAQMWEIPLENVVWKDGHAHATGDGHGNLAPLSLKEIAASAPNTGGPIAGHAEITADGAGVSFATASTPSRPWASTTRTMIARRCSLSSD